MLPNPCDWAIFQCAAYPDWLPAHWHGRAPRNETVGRYRRHSVQGVTMKRLDRRSTAMRQTGQPPKLSLARSEERRVGKEGRCRRGRLQLKAYEGTSSK